MSLARQARMIEAVKDDLFVPPIAATVRQPDERLLSRIMSDQPFGRQVLAPNLQRYWNDPAYRAEIAAERAEHYRQANALIDEGIRKARERRAEREAEAKECGR